VSTPSPKENLTRLTLYGMGWEYTSVFLQALLQLAVLAILARLLTQEEFGLIGMAMIFVGIAGLLSQLSVSQAIVQIANLTQEHVSVGFTLSLLLSLVMSLLLWMSAPSIALFFGTDSLTPILRALSPSFILAGLGSVSEAMLQRELQFKKLAQANIGSYVFGYAGVSILLASFGFGVWALVWATMGQALVKTVLLFRLRPHSLRVSLPREERDELLRLGGGFTLARIFNYAANQGDYLVVGRILGAGALGTYTRAYQLMMLPANYLGQALQRVLFPAMSKIQDDPQRLRRTYFTSVATISLVTAPISVLMVVAAPEIVEVLLGRRWLNTVLPFQVLTVGALFRTSYKTDDSLAKALGVAYKRSVRDAIYAAAVLVGSLLGTRWGLEGTATGVLFAVLLNYVLGTSMSLRLLNASWIEVLKAQTAGIQLSIIVLVVALGTRSMLLTQGLPALLVLVGVAAVSGASLLAVCFFRPDVLGRTGTEALRKALSIMPSHTLATAILKRLETVNSKAA
jgi:O-antigen/teichoic acid export membrane protein